MDPLAERQIHAIHDSQGPEEDLGARIDQAGALGIWIEPGRNLAEGEFPLAR